MTYDTAALLLRYCSFLPLSPLRPYLGLYIVFICQLSFSSTYSTSKHITRSLVVIHSIHSIRILATFAFFTHTTLVNGISTPIRKTASNTSSSSHHHHHHPNPRTLLRLLPVGHLSPFLQSLSFPYPLVSTFPRQPDSITTHLLRYFALGTTSFARPR